VVFLPSIAIMLNEPGPDFTGGQNVFVEHGHGCSLARSWPDPNSAEG